MGAPLGSYYRVGRDYRPLQAVLAEDRYGFSGLIFDAASQVRQAELLKAAEGRLESVLDTRALELSTIGGIQNENVRALPWAGDQLPHNPALLSGPFGDHLVNLIADAVASNPYSAVQAPCHLLSGGADDPWLDIDLTLTRGLRRALDARGLQNVPIYYPLILRGTVLGSPATRTALAMKLGGSPIDAIWLRVHPFGATNAGPLALRRYIEAAQDLHTVGLPLVAERVGTVGVALMAFGAVGGIESGITLGERFDVGALVNKPKQTGGGFAPAPRVYLAPIGAFVSREQARTLLARPGLRSALGCRDTSCCRRGPVDTQLDPRRHFILQRDREVNALSRRPETVRAGTYLEEFLRPATDLALRAARQDSSLDVIRQRLEGWRRTLGAINQQGPARSFAIVPEGKRVDARLRRNA